MADPGDTFDESKNWQLVNLQGGVPLEGDKYNIDSQARWHNQRRSICELIGNGTSNNGFLLSNFGAAPLDPDIGEGDIFVCGLKVEVPAGLTYLTQPNAGSVPPVANPTDGFFYLKVTVEEIGFGDDPEIIDPAIGIECVKPWKLDWTVIWQAGTGVPAAGPLEYLLGLFLRSTAFGDTDFRNIGDVDAGGSTGYEDREGGRLGSGHEHWVTDVWIVGPLACPTAYADIYLNVAIEDLDTRLNFIETSGPPPMAHAPTHEDLGLDPISLANFAAHCFGDLNVDSTDTDVMYRSRVSIPFGGGNLKQGFDYYPTALPTSAYGVSAHIFNRLDILHTEDPGVYTPMAFQWAWLIGASYTVPLVSPSNETDSYNGTVALIMGSCPDYYAIPPWEVLLGDDLFGWNWTTGEMTVDDVQYIGSLRSRGITADIRSPERHAWSGTNVLLEGYHMPIYSAWDKEPFDDRERLFSHIHCWRGPLSITTNNLDYGMINEDVLSGYGTGGNEPFSWTRLSARFIARNSLWIDHMSIEAIILGNSPSTARVENPVDADTLLRDAGDLDEDGYIGVFEWNLMNQKYSGRIEYGDTETWASRFGNPIYFDDDNSFMVLDVTGTLRSLDLSGDFAVTSVDRSLMINAMTFSDGVKGFPNIICPSYESTVNRAVGDPSGLSYADESSPKTRREQALNLGHVWVEIIVDATILSNWNAGNPIIVVFDPTDFFYHHIYGVTGCVCELFRGATRLGMEPCVVVDSFQVNIKYPYTGQGALGGFGVGIIPVLNDVFHLRVLCMKEYYEVP